jgi:hypothetical protein
MFMVMIEFFDIVYHPRLKNLQLHLIQLSLTSDLQNYGYTYLLQSMFRLWGLRLAHF